jgi:hypothetical protein
VVEGTDLLGHLRAAPGGLSAKQAARFMEGATDKARESKARRRLEELVTRGLAYRRPGDTIRGGVHEPDTYFATPSRRGPRGVGMTGTLTGTRPVSRARPHDGNARERRNPSLQVTDGNATGTHGNAPHGNAGYPPLRGFPFRSFSLRRGFWRRPRGCSARGPSRSSRSAPATSWLKSSAITPPTPSSTTGAGAATARLPPTALTRSPRPRSSIGRADDGGRLSPGRDPRHAYRTSQRFLQGRSFPGARSSARLPWPARNISHRETPSPR